MRAGGHGSAGCGDLGRDVVGGDDRGVETRDLEGVEVGRDDVVCPRDSGEGVVEGEESLERWHRGRLRLLDTGRRGLGAGSRRRGVARACGDLGEERGVEGERRRGRHAAPRLARRSEVGIRIREGERLVRQGFEALEPQERRFGGRGSEGADGQEEAGVETDGNGPAGGLVELTGQQAGGGGVTLEEVGRDESGRKGGHREGHGEREGIGGHPRTRVDRDARAALRECLSATLLDDRQAVGPERVGVAACEGCRRGDDLREDE